MAYCEEVKEVYWAQAGAMRGIMEDEGEDPITRIRACRELTRVTDRIDARAHLELVDRDRREGHIEAD